MTTIVDIERLEIEEGLPEELLDGLPYSGIAYELGAATGGVIAVMGYLKGVLDGPCRMWSRSGRMTAERYYFSGGLHGPMRTWFEDGRPQHDDYWEAQAVHRRRVWTEAGELKEERVLAADSPEQARLAKVRRDRGIRPIIDIDLATWTFFERPWGWGLDPADLPPPVPAPKLPAIPGIGVASELLSEAGGKPGC